MMCAACDETSTPPKCAQCHDQYVLGYNGHCQPISGPQFCAEIETSRTIVEEDWMNPKSKWLTDHDWSQLNWYCKRCDENYIVNNGWEKMVDGNPVNILIRNCKKSDDLSASDTLRCDSGSGDARIGSCDLCAELETSFKNSDVAKDGNNVECLRCREKFKRNHYYEPLSNEHCTAAELVKEKAIAGTEVIPYIELMNCKTTDGTSDFDRKVRFIETGPGNDYTAGSFLDYGYCKTSSNPIYSVINNFLLF